VFTASDHEAILLTVGGPPCQSQPTTGPRKAYRPETFRPQTFASALKGLAVSELDRQAKQRTSWQLHKNYFHLNGYIFYDAKHPDGKAMSCHNLLQPIYKLHQYTLIP